LAGERRNSVNPEKDEEIGQEFQTDLALLGRLSAEQLLETNSCSDNRGNDELP
jgi:hypothetical protein